MATSRNRDMTSCAIPRDRIVVVTRDEDRAGAVGHRKPGEHDAADQQAGDQEHHDAGHQHGGERRAIAELTEPQPVDVGVDESRARERRRRSHRARSRSESGCAESARHPCGGPHPHWLRSLIDVAGIHLVAGCCRFSWTVTTVRTAARRIAG